MIDKKTVFVLGAGASCPYGYPSGARLQELICSKNGGFGERYGDYVRNHKREADYTKHQEVNKFRETFGKAHLKSIDTFMANNPKLAPIGKYIIAFEIFWAEMQSLFGVEAKLAKEHFVYDQNHDRYMNLLSVPLFLGEDWYSYMYDQIRRGRVGKDALPDFSDGKLAFITFNYDRSLEQFFYESLRNSFTETSEDRIIQSLRQLKILHVYGQIAPLKWQDSEQGVDYRQEISEPLLQKAAANIKTIYEQKESLELDEAKGLLAQAEQIFFLGFGYAPENMEILNLPSVISATAVYTCEVYGTAFSAEDKEISDIQGRFVKGLKPGSDGWKNTGQIKIVNMDCLKLLRNYS